MKNSKANIKYEKNVHSKNNKILIKIPSIMLSELSF